VGSQADRSEVASFVDDFKVGGFVQLVDEDGSLWQRLGATIRSSFLFVGRDGAVQRTGYGEMTEAKLRDTVLQLSEH
jgi:hypothetical protein